MQATGVGVGGTAEGAVKAAIMPPTGLWITRSVFRGLILLAACSLEGI